MFRAVESGNGRGFSSPRRLSSRRSKSPGIDDMFVSERAITSDPPLTGFVGTAIVVFGLVVVTAHGPLRATPPAACCATGRTTVVAIRVVRRSCAKGPPWARRRLRCRDRRATRFLRRVVAESRQRRGGAAALRFCCRTASTPFDGTQVRLATLEVIAQDLTGGTCRVKLLLLLLLVLALPLPPDVRPLEERRQHRARPESHQCGDDGPPRRSGAQAVDQFSDLCGVHGHLLAGAGHLQVARPRLT